MGGNIDQAVVEASRKFAESGRTITPNGYGRQQVGTTCIGGHVKASGDGADNWKQGLK